MKAKLHFFANYFSKGENRPVLVSPCLEYCLILVVASYIAKTFIPSPLLYSLCVLFLSSCFWLHFTKSYWLCIFFTWNTKTKCLPLVVTIFCCHFSLWKASWSGKLDLKEHCNIMFFSFTKILFYHLFSQMLRSNSWYRTCLCSHGS